jgi:cysteine sulfinate desulfinase/cysteine desulfurase-like protein
MQPQAVHRQTVYLDHAAATPMHPEVAAAIADHVHACAKVKMRSFVYK